MTAPEPPARGPGGRGAQALVEPTAQQTFDGMPRRLLSAAPSRLTTYLDCPRRYRFGYLDRPMPPKGPPWAHNSFGAAVHTVLANWWKAPRERRTVELVGPLLDDAWLVDGYRDDEQRAAAKGLALAMLQRYVAGLDPWDEPVGVERTVAMKTEHAALYGRVDRIDDRAGAGLVVVDYKTGRQVLTVDDARTSLALAVYALATARTLRRSCARVELHHLPTGDVLAWEHSDESLARQLRRVDALAEEIAAKDDAYRAATADVDELFPTAPGPMCGWCDFNRVCSDGRAAASPRDPWSGLALALA